MHSSEALVAKCNLSPSQYEQTCLGVACTHNGWMVSCYALKVNVIHKSDDQTSCRESNSTLIDFACFMDQRACPERHVESSK